MAPAGNVVDRHAKALNPPHMQTVDAFLLPGYTVSDLSLCMETWKTIALTSDFSHPLALGNSL